MKLGFNEATALECKGQSLMADLEMCEKYGFDYIEIRFDCVKDYLKEHTLEELADWFKNHNLKPWAYNTLIFFNQRDEAGEKENKKSFEELKKIADLMDVEIIFEGELPQTEKEQRVIYALLRESLNNMIKHAGGHYLYIEIDNSGEDVQICLHNDGEIPKQKIEEKGGLRNLRMMVESIDGEFRIESFPIFAIYVTLKKEKVWRK